MRQIVLDTETTGLEYTDGHRVIEIGCVEVLNRQISGHNFHKYLQPDRHIDEGAIEVHGITNEFLADKPRFADVMTDFISYVDGAELIIHNAPFDVGFLNSELNLAGYKGEITDHCQVLDTLAMARQMYPGQRNTLDALCKRLDINNAHRTLHGALLDSEILADVYLRMTGGQTDLVLDADAADSEFTEDNFAANSGGHHKPRKLSIVRANDDELEEHHKWLQILAGESANGCQWTE